MKLPSRKKSTIIPFHPFHLLQMEQMKGPGGTSPTQRAYRSHTSDLIARLDLLLAPKKLSTSADANGNRLPDPLGSKQSSVKSRPRNVVLRDLVDILTKIWRDEKSLELLEVKRDENVPSPPPPVEDEIGISETPKACEDTKISPKVETIETLRSSLLTDDCAEVEHVCSELHIGAFNSGEPFLQSWVPVPEINAADLKLLDEQPSPLICEESSCASSESDEDFEGEGFMMDAPQSPPDSPFEEICAPAKEPGFGVGWSAFPVEEAPLMAW
jgi:hypothetical protein